MSASSKMRVLGNSVLYVTGNVGVSGGAYIEISPGVTLGLYVGGASASFGGNGILNRAGNAMNFQYYGLPSNATLNLTGSGEFIGVIYAPSANLSVSGGGTERFDIFGSLVTRSASVLGLGSFHYDESLERFGPFR
jgi:hypothetical protein